MKDNRKQPSCDGMSARLIRQVFAILIAMVLIGAPVVQATIAMPCDAVVSIALDRDMSAGQNPPPAPCKGMMPGCVDLRGCGLSAGLPTQSSAVAHTLIWQSTAYRAVADLHEGLSVEPDLGPPIAI